MAEEILRVEKIGKNFNLYINNLLVTTAKAFKPYQFLNEISKSCRELFYTDTDEAFEEDIIK